MINQKTLMVTFLPEQHYLMHLVINETITLELDSKQDLETQHHKINTLV